MRNLNSVLIEGNLTQDPESRTTSGGTLLCKFSIGANRSFKSKSQEALQEEVSYFSVDVWGERAEPCIAYLKKGKKVRVLGRLKQERWEAADGSKRDRVVIVAEHVEFGPGGKKMQEMEMPNESTG